ncbi:MAG: hypothetical protein COW60_02240 [Candidatus Yonathbacteria bacterium CG17_big_fil_post_rev_8_21_14_2_50_43_9]|nr:MAG: hypothetical protein COW60_02240 [Candidatus Yonathbacteria bacterium CG17_big_fil_post_rev_8_21_14_2_50_43_9]
MTLQPRKKVLFLITKSNWGGAPWKPLGFPTFARNLALCLPPQGTSWFPDPLRSPHLLLISYA